MHELSTAEIQNILRRRQPQKDIVFEGEVQKIGSGAQATVYLVGTRNSERVEQLVIRIAKYKEETEALERIIENMEEFKQIGRVIDYFEDKIDDKTLFCQTMKYYPNGDFQKQLDAGQTKFSMANVMELINAVYELHLKGIAHGDISPRNVLISKKGTCKLADFGFSVLNDSPSYEKTIREDLLFLAITIYKLVTNNNTMEFSILKEQPQLMIERIDNPPIAELLNTMIVLSKSETTPSMGDVIRKAFDLEIPEAYDKLMFPRDMDIYSKYYFMKNLLQKCSDRSDFWEELADLYYSADQSNDALIASQKALFLNKKSQRAIETIVKSFEKQGDIQKAARAITTLMPNYKPKFQERLKDKLRELNGGRC